MPLRAAAAADATPLLIHCAHATLRRAELLFYAFRRLRATYIRHTRHYAYAYAAADITLEAPLFDAADYLMLLAAAFIFAAYAPPRCYALICRHYAHAYLMPPRCRRFSSPLPPRYFRHVRVYEMPRTRLLPCLLDAACCCLYAIAIADMPLIFFDAFIFFLLIDAITDFIDVIA